MSEQPEYAQTPAPDWLRKRDSAESPLAGMRRQQGVSTEDASGYMEKSTRGERQVQSKFEINFDTAFKFGLAFGMGMALSVPVLVILVVLVLALLGITFSQ